MTGPTQPPGGQSDPDPQPATPPAPPAPAAPSGAPYPPPAPSYPPPADAGTYGTYPPPPAAGSYGTYPPPAGAGTYGTYPPPTASGPYGGYPPAPPPMTAPQVGPGGLVLDQASGLYLPPGTQLASVGRRIGAYFLAIPLAIVTLGIGYVVWGLIVWGRGTTPALQVLGMRCYQPDTHTVPGFWRMALREVVGRIVDGILSLITEITSFVLFCTSAKRQSLHDLVGGTVVLHDPGKVLG